MRYVCTVSLRITLQITDGRLPFLTLTIITCIITVIFAELLPLVSKKKHPERLTFRKKYCAICAMTFNSDDICIEASAANNYIKKKEEVKLRFQAICNRRGLQIASKTRYVTWLAMMVLSPVVWPISKILDIVLGSQGYSRWFESVLRHQVKNMLSSSFINWEIQLI